MSGRVYVLGQVLAREHERSAELRQQLERSNEEIERLRGEVEQLRRHEGDLRAALEKAVAAANADSTAGPAAVSAADNSAAPKTGDGDANGREAALAAAAEAQQRQLEQQHAAMVAELRTALKQEQTRRQKVETELARLKTETSPPPYASNPASDADLAAANEQVVQLRAALDEERAARARLAQDFRTLQRRATAENDGVQNASAENTELRSQLEHLQQEKQTIAQSFKQSLAESQARTAELEHELTLARSTDHAQPGADGELANVQAENAALRSRLDEEHQRTEELGAKLKMALRVTDLIFKMQAQQTTAAAHQ